MDEQVTKNENQKSKSSKRILYLLKPIVKFIKSGLYKKLFFPILLIIFGVYLLYFSLVPNEINECFAGI